MTNDIAQKLIKIAHTLEFAGLFNESDQIDKLIKTAAGEGDWWKELGKFGEALWKDLFRTKDINELNRVAKEGKIKIEGIYGRGTPKATEVYNAFTQDVKKQLQKVGKNERIPQKVHERFDHINNTYPSFNDKMALTPEKAITKEDFYGEAQRLLKQEFGIEYAHPQVNITGLDRASALSKIQNVFAQREKDIRAAFSKNITRENANELATELDKEIKNLHANGRIELSRLESMYPIKAPKPSMSPAAKAATGVAGAAVATGIGAAAYKSINNPGTTSIRVDVPRDIGKSVSPTPKVTVKPSASQPVGNIGFQQELKNPKKPFENQLEYDNRIRINSYVNWAIQMAKKPEYQGREEDIIKYVAKQDNHPELIPSAITRLYS